MGLANSNAMLTLALSFCLAASTLGSASASAALDDVGLAPANAPLPRAALADLSAPDTVVLSGDDLLRRGYRTLGDVLSFELGVVRTRGGRGISTQAFGVPGGLVLVVDGVARVVDGERGVLDVDEMLPLQDVLQVEIVRGPVTALSGAGALTGAVRVTLKPAGVTGVAVRAGGSAFSSGTALPPVTGGERELSAEGTLRQGDLGVRGFARVRSGPPFLWRVEHAPTRFERTGGALLPVRAADVTVSPGDDDAVVMRVSGQLAFVTADVAYGYTSTHAPLSSFSHGLVDTPDTVTREQARVRVGLDHYVGPLRIQGALTGSRHDNAVDVPLFPRGGTFVDGGALNLRSRALFANATARLDVPLTESHRLLFGGVLDLADLAQSASSTDPRTGARAPTRTSLADQTSGGSLSGEYQGDLPFGLAVTAGVAVELRARFPVVVAPRAAVAWEIADGARLRVSDAEGVRAPDRFDLRSLSEAVEDGRVVGVADNTALRPEHVRMLDGGITYQPSYALRVSTRVFALRHEDALAWRSAADVLRPANLAPRTAGGGEVFASTFPFGDVLQLVGGVFGVHTLDGPDLRSDALQATLAANASLAPGVVAGMRTRAVHFLGAQAQSPDAARVDATLAFDPLPALSISLAVMNVFDANERTIDDTGLPIGPAATYPGPGRALTLAVEGRL